MTTLRRRSSYCTRRRGQVTVEFALLLVVQLFMFLIPLQFMIVAFADSVNAYSGHLAARSNAVHQDCQAAAARFFKRVYGRPDWQTPPAIERLGRDTCLSLDEVPLDMPWVGRAMSAAGKLTVASKVSVFQELRGDSGDNAARDGH